MSNPKYKRILLKLSGDAFKGDREYGIDPKFLNYIASELNEVVNCGTQIGIVIGGGNIFRGISAAANGMDRVTADYSGMLATIMNALALQDSLRKIDIPCCVQTSIEMKEIAEPFILGRALSHFQKGHVVIFAGGTGNPYFTTDTAAALRAAEIGAEAVFKATKVDGVYDCDPESNTQAKKYTRLSYIDIIRDGLQVMDSTAITLCMDNNIPIVVFDLKKKGNIKKILAGDPIGTTINTEEVTK